MSMKKNIFKRALSMAMAVLMVLSCWVWFEPAQVMADAAASTIKDHYLFAYFTGTSKEGQTIHLAVSEDGYTYTALRGNDPVIIPSKGVGCVRDPYIWYNEQDNYYYILATDLDFTDGGGDYSNNSQSFIIWRSKDLVNWYDETMIDVNKMAHLIGDTRNMSAVWAPQVLWDGSAYVVYFTLACNATSWFDIVYLKTTDLLDPNAYYEFDYILGNSKGNGVDNGYGVIDADIIHNPGDGKYYLFYKTECNSHEMGSTQTGSSLKTIHYYVGDTPTGPFRNPGDNKWSNAGFSVFPNYNVSLEGCNSFFDNDGNLIMYADEFEHKNASGEAEAYFHIAKSNGTNFKSWSYPDVSQHNINSLSPRHGSVVKITENEYNRLLENSYAISSSSFPASETLEDHLVARYFTTNDASYNAVVGGANLDVVSSNVSMTQTATGSWVADFNTGYAEIDLEKLFLNGLNYKDGFSITFKAKVPEGALDNVRFYEITDKPGTRTGVEHYTHLSPKAQGNGIYMGTYNGPEVKRLNQDVRNSHDWASDRFGINRDDNKWHEYLVSYANGNYIVYVDGTVCIMKNRFNTAAILNDLWYDAIGSSTLYIGRSGFRYDLGSNIGDDADFTGQIRDFCIYDTSMSYYDLQAMDSQIKGQLEYIDGANYTGITSVVPTFQNTNADRMNSLPNKNQHFSNILYTSNTVRNFDGNNMSQDSAVWHHNGNDFYFALYYPETTVLLLDGKNDAIMPVSFGAYCENSRASKGFLKVYPTAGPGSTADLGELEISQNWGGWYNNGDYYNCIVTHEDGYIGRNSTTSSWSHITDKKNYDCHWGAPLKVNPDKINFGGSYYKKFNLTWQVTGGTDGNYAADHSANMTSDNDIYVIDFRHILELRSKITESEYNKVMNGDYCQTLKEKYADAVFSIQTLDPRSYDFTKNAEVGTKALARAIKDAMDNYNGVIEIIKAQDATGVYGHETEILPARVATCEYNGLTQGEICRLCGEVIVPQNTLATVPHTFTDVTEGGVKYKKCTVCGVMIEYQASGVRYANLFSFNAWASSSSAQVFSGTISKNTINGTITIVNQNNSEMYTRGHYDGQDLVSTRDFGNYCIPVTGGGTYVVEATSLATSTSHGEVFIFQYDKNGLVYKTIPTVLGLNPGQTAHNEFTVDSNAAYIELRFDCNDAGKTITYSQIGIYEKEEFDKFGATTADARLGFYPGDDIELCYPNPAPGYIFDGWYTVDGRLIENVNQLNNPTTIVYGKWLTAGYDVVYDSIFSFSEWAKSSCNQLWYGDQKDANGNVTRLVSHDGVFADTENGTITLYNDEDTNYFARTNYWEDYQNVHTMNITPNTEYILEYTVTSEDGGKPSVCLYITGGTAQYPETGAATRYSTGTHYYRFNPGDNNKLTLRFDNVQNGSTVTFSNIAVYKADFEEAARNIDNREYRRYYPTKMGIGDVFEYTPTRPGFTFETWLAETNFSDDKLGDFDMRNLDDTFIVENNWQLYSTWTENSYTIQYNANGGSGSIATQTVNYTQPKELAKTGFTRTGYTLKGWSTIQSATTAQYQLGQSVSRLNGDPNGTTTLYAVWVKNEPVNITFDNLIDFKAWNKVAGNGTVTDITDTGMSITCNSGSGEATSSSPFFAVEPGKQYKIDIDITGPTWDVYIFFCDANGSWIDFVDGPSNRYSNNGGGSKTQIFTAPDKESVVKAQIRLDANGSNTKVNFNDIRVYEYNGYETSVSPANKIADSGLAVGELPVPTREGHAFIGWYSGNTEYTATTVVNGADTIYLTSEWLNMDKAYVLDFAVKTEFKPLDNDEFKEYFSSYKITGISNSKDAAGSTTVAGTFGTFALNGNSITYTATSIMSKADIVYYHVDCNGYQFISSITVYPATVVYYEDDVNSAVTYTNGKSADNSTGTWKTTGTSQLASATQNLADKIYGYTDAYKNSSDPYSMGSAHYVSVSAKNNPNSKYSGSEGNDWPYAEFTFAGTGFDVVSLISKDTGSVNVIVTKDGKQVYNWLIDTYYGYTYENGEWVVSSANNTMYQIPVIGKTDMDYGTYTVKIIPTYSSRLDHVRDGAYDFYIDAIRVYNPMQGDIDAETLYLNDGEYVVEHKAIRDILIDAKNFGENNQNGVVYINQSKPQGTFEDYSKIGPKNEVYLANGQSVAFSMTVSGFTPTSVQISAHALNGTASMRFGSGASYSIADSISHKTTLYYEVPFTDAGYYWNDNGDGLYTLSAPIVITNNGDGILSLCNIKVTSDVAVNVEPLMFMMNDDDFNTAVYSVERMSALTEDDGALFVPDDMTSGADSEVVEKGDDVVVTINTSAEVYALTVNGEEATLVSVNEDGSKTWNYTFVTENRGEQTFTLVAYDVHGFASEEQTVTVDVQSKIEIFFNKISKFISMIIEFLNNFAG